MNNEPEPGMGFLPTVSSPKKRIAPDVVPNPAPAPVVNNYNAVLDAKAAEAVRDAAEAVRDAAGAVRGAVFVVLVLVLFLFIALKHGPKLLQA